MSCNIITKAANRARTRTTLRNKRPRHRRPRHRHDPHPLAAALRDELRPLPDHLDNGYP
jgi:hypothetical protein